jgi:hypothetical protein
MPVCPLSGAPRSCGIAAIRSADSGADTRHVKQSGLLGFSSKRSDRTLPHAVRTAARREFLCWVPGLVGFVAYALYPALILPMVASPLAEWIDATPTARDADVVILIVGIVVSAICWFYAHSES